MNGFFIQYVVKCNLGKVNFNVVSQSGLYSYMPIILESPKSWGRSIIKGACRKIYDF